MPFPSLMRFTERNQANPQILFIHGLFGLFDKFRVCDNLGFGILWWQIVNKLAPGRRNRALAWLLSCGLWHVCALGGDQMAKARLETNFIRLLDMCKNMGNNGKHTEWRFEKVSLISIESQWCFIASQCFFLVCFLDQYVATLDEYLLEMSKGPMAPDKEEMDEYLRSVKFLRGLIVTEKSVIIL